MAHKDDVLKKIMEKCNAKNIVASQVEGSFYSREIFEKIADATQGIDFSQGESYTREELVFSTIAYSFSKRKISVIQLPIQRYTDMTGDYGRYKESITVSVFYR